MAIRCARAPQGTHLCDAFVDFRIVPYHSADGGRKKSISTVQCARLPHCAEIGRLAEGEVPSEATEMVLGGQFQFSAVCAAKSSSH